MGLAHDLREGTRESHARAESAAFVRAWLRGSLDATAILEYLARLAIVYRALEGALDRLHGHPLLAPIDRPELRRLPALQADLHAHRISAAPSPAAETYAARVAAATPERLVAHCYTRYLGDLSGGLFLGKLARRAMGAGLAFFAFPLVPDPRAYKAGYRRALDALPLDAVTIRDVVAEAVVTFALNEALFHELDPLLVARDGVAS